MIIHRMTAPLTIALLFALIITVCEPLFLSLAPEMAPQLISYTELPRKVSPPHNSVSPKSILERNSNEEGYRLIFTSRELLHYPRNKNKNSHVDKIRFSRISRNSFNSFMENLNIVKTTFYFNFISVIKICN